MQSAFQRGVSIGVVLLALALAGCGVSSTEAANAGVGTSSPTATATATTAAAPTGCPDAAQGVTWPTPATAQLSLTQVVAMVAVGQSVEVVLPVTLQWHFVPTSAQGVLQLQQPAGYLDVARQSCVWRFVAQAKGESTLAFTHTSHCVPNTKCSDVAVALPLTVTVS